jgi:hypothetical protein
VILTAICISSDAGSDYSESLRLISTPHERVQM